MISADIMPMDASKSNQNDDYSGTYVTSYATYVLTYNKSTNSIHEKAIYSDSEVFEHDYVYSGSYNGITYFDLDSDEDKDSIMFAVPDLCIHMMVQSSADNNLYM